MTWLTNFHYELFIQGLKSELEKASPSLGRSSLYLKDSRINDLPRYELQHYIPPLFWFPSIVPVSDAFIVFYCVFGPLKMWLCFSGQMK